MIDDDSKNKLKEALSAMDPVEFKWDETNMSTQTGFTAQEVDYTTVDLSGSCDTTTISPIDLGNISIAGGAVNGGSSYFGSNGIGASSWSISSQPAINITNTEGKNFIQTNKHKIDIDELGDMLETLKKRLLILTPNFEMHEKYPMLKELYNEYKAMEKLLGGPDSNE